MYYALHNTCGPVKPIPEICFPAPTFPLGCPPLAMPPHPSIRAAALGLFLAASAARAAVRVEFDGIDGPLLENVRLHVGSPPGDSPLVLRRFAQGARSRALEALEALGRCDAAVRLSSFADGPDRVLRFSVDPGDPVLLSSVSVSFSGEAASDPAFAELRSRLPLRPGDVLDHGRYEEAKRSIQTLALSRGYFRAAFSTNQILVHRGQRRADVSLAFDSGPRFRLGEVRIPPLPFSRTLLRRLVPFRAGDPYSADQISALQRNYVDSDFFEDVRIRPRPDLADVSLDVPVDAELSLAPRNRIGAGVGATTDVGPRLRLEWRRPWTNRRGHSALLKSEASLVRQNLSALYSVPLNPPLDHQLQFSGEWKREEIEDTESETRRVGVQRRRLHRGGWEQILSLRRESERFTQADVHEVTGLTLPGFSLGRTRRRGGVIPARGDRLFALFETAHPDFFSDLRLSRILLQARRLDSFGPHSLLARIEYGALDTSDFDRTPPPCASSPAATKASGASHTNLSAPKTTRANSSAAATCSRPPSNTTSSSLRAGSSPPSSTPATLPPTPASPMASPAARAPASAGSPPSPPSNSISPGA